MKRGAGIHAHLSVTMSYTLFEWFLYTDYLILEKYYEKSHPTSQMKKAK